MFHYNIPVAAEFEYAASSCEEIPTYKIGVSLSLLFKHFTVLSMCIEVNIIFVCSMHMCSTIQTWIAAFAVPHFYQGKFSLIWSVIYNSFSDVLVGVTVTALANTKSDKYSIQ